MRITEMNWMRVAEYLAGDDRAVVPLGSTEQHAYLSLGTDAILAERVAVEAAEPLGVPVFPALAYGITPYFRAFPGTVSLRVSTYIALVGDVLDGLAEQGFRRIVLVNGHGGNSPAGSYAAEWMAEHPGVTVIMHNWWNAPRTWQAVQEIDPVASHGSWMENFPWNRVAPSPAGQKPMADLDRLRRLAPAGCPRAAGRWQLRRRLPEARRADACALADRRPGDPRGHRGRIARPAGWRRHPRPIQSAGIGNGRQHAAHTGSLSGGASRGDPRPTCSISCVSRASAPIRHAAPRWRPAPTGSPIACGRRVRSTSRCSRPPAIPSSTRSGSARPAGLRYSSTATTMCNRPIRWTAWTSAPFAPEIRDGRIYARGVSDDKGPMLIPIQVAEAFFATQGTPADQREDALRGRGGDRQPPSG